jgi:hypothetical protein
MKTTLWTLLFLPLLALAQTAPGWDAARKAIAADYARHQPGAKVLEISGPDKRDAVLIAVRYWGTTLVERADKMRSRDKVWVEYRLVGDRWELQAVKVYESTALSDIEPPARERAQALFAAAWKDKCEGYEIHGITLDGDPRYQLETTNDPNPKRWYVYRLKVAAKGNGKFRMSEDGASYENVTQNLLLWNPADKSWTVEQRQLRCSFTKLK